MPAAAFTTVTVNVALCGSIPRNGQCGRNDEINVRSGVQGNRDIVGPSKSRKEEGYGSSKVEESAESRSNCCRNFSPVRAFGQRLPARSLSVRLTSPNADDEATAIPRSCEISTDIISLGGPTQYSKSANQTLKTGIHYVECTSPHPLVENCRVGVELKVGHSCSKIHQISTIGSQFDFSSSNSSSEQIERKQEDECSSIPRHPTSAHSSEENCNHNNMEGSSSQPQCEEVSAIAQRADIAIPAWACAAPGEARLEPVSDARACGALGSIDLSRRSVYHIGRSPTNDVALYHRTSSRRHALIFHHPCGLCYVLDCRSVHGTFVNGRRIASRVPFQLKRGNLIRFGGPGAPAFILKRFDADFDRMVRDLDCVAQAFGEHAPQTKEVRMLEHQAKTNGLACIHVEGGMACVVNEDDAAAAALVLLNTRLNACGGLASLSESRFLVARRASAEFVAKAFPRQSLLGSKRGRDEEDDELSVKKCRTKSILVRNDSKSLSFDDELSVETVSTAETMFTTSSLDTQEARRKRVIFSDDMNVSFFPTAVTPDELSSDSECDGEEVIEILPDVVAATL